MTVVFFRTRWLPNVAVSPDIWCHVPELLPILNTTNSTTKASIHILSMYMLCDLLLPGVRSLWYGGSASLWYGMQFSISMVWHVVQRLYGMACSSASLWYGMQFSVSMVWHAVQRLYGMGCGSASLWYGMQFSVSMVWRFSVSRMVPLWVRQVS